MEKIAKITGINSAVLAGAEFGFETAYSLAIDRALQVAKNAPSDAEGRAAATLAAVLHGEREIAKKEFLLSFKIDETFIQ